MSKFAAILDVILGLAANLKALASAYRVLVLSVLGLVLTIAAIWAFFRHPQGLIVATLAAILAYVFGPPLMAWARGES